MPPCYTLWRLLRSCLTIFLLLLHMCFCYAANDTLTAAQAMAAGDKLVSRNGKFALGFFSVSPSSGTTTSSSSDNTSTWYYLGIWINKIPDFTPVWIANRDDPIVITDLKPKTLKISTDGNLVVTAANQTAVLWSTGIGKASSRRNSSNTIAVLANTGNLVLRDALDPSKVWWQSFDYPTDVYLPGSKLGRNKITGLNRVFVSKKNRVNPARGAYCVGVDASFSQGIILSHCASSVVYWASGTFTLKNVDPSDSGFISYNQIDNSREQYYIYTTPNDSLSVYTMVETNGQINGRVWVENLQQWRVFYTQPMDPCSVHAACGPFTICTSNNNAVNASCDCMKGFSVSSPREWDLDDRAGGCRRNNPLDCATDRFLPVSGVALAYNPTPMSVVGGASECAKACASDCSSLLIPTQAPGALSGMEICSTLQQLPLLVRLCTCDFLPRTIICKLIWERSTRDIDRRMLGLLLLLQPLVGQYLGCS